MFVGYDLELTLIGWDDSSLNFLLGIPKKCGYHGLIANTQPP
jgi:hypothetical protein